MGVSDDESMTELKRKMRIAYVFALVAMAAFLVAASVSAMSAAIR